MSKVIILGAGGVFANHFAKHCLDVGYSKVIAVGRNPRLGNCFTLGVGVEDTRYEYHQIHIVFEQRRLLELFDAEKPEFVFNYAALAYANSWDDSDLFYNTNCVSVVQLVAHLKRSNYLQRFVQIGTSEMYGPTISKPAKEYDIPNPTSPYAVSKLATDMHLNTLFNVEEFPMNIVRPSNCYGTGQYVYRIIPKAILYFLYNKPFPLEGGGLAEKSFMYVDDLNKAIELIINKGKIGDTYNVGPDKPISMHNIVLEICRQMNKDPEEFIEFRQGRVGEDRKYWIDSQKIKRELDWKPEVSFEQGISKMIEWVIKYKADLVDSPDQFILRA